MIRVWQLISYQQKWRRESITRITLAFQEPRMNPGNKDKKQQMPTPNGYIYDSTERTPPDEGAHLCHVYIHSG